jgi:hypothetical protein
MSTANNVRPKPTAGPAIVLRDVGAQEDGRRHVLRLVPAALFSVLFHGVLLGVFFLVAPSPREAAPTEQAKDDSLQAESPSEEKKDPLLATDIDPAAQEPDTDINYMIDRKAEVSVPGAVDPSAAVGIMDGNKENSPTNLPAPGGFGSSGQGGAIETANMGNSEAVGMVGGYGPRGMPLQGTFFGRSGATREYALRNGGGTTASEAAVARGLKWLVRVQMPDGRWKLDHPAFKEKGLDNDVAATAFGLLPLLAAGKTHRPAKDNPYDKPIEKGLTFLIRRQDRKTGLLGEKGAHHSAYGHGIATITLCEAYGLTQDSNLRRPAQMAINYIVMAQHEGGGWRYTPGSPGDLSVAGWMIMALKSALMAGLDVPAITLRKAQNFLEASCDTKSEGYTYTPGGGGTPVMTAVGLLGRQYLQSWGPQNLRMIKSIDNFIKRTPPTTPNCYYYYYATQVMHHFGGESWKKWNDPMRETLIKRQDSDQNSPSFGSWSAKGDAWATSGGRLMVTSLNLLTLEVYYRYLPLYYREAGAKKDEAVQKAQ